MFHRRMGFRARFLRINYASSREAGTSSRLGAALLNSALRVRRNSYITKHSTAKGGKPRKPGAGISKIFQPRRIRRQVQPGENLREGPPGPFPILEEVKLLSHDS